MIKVGIRGTKEEGRRTIVHRPSSIVHRVLILSSIFYLLSSVSFAQETSLEFTIDLDGSTVALPNIFKPNIDLSGRGFHQDPAWPQNLASYRALEAWEKDIGFNGVYRLQYNLWEIGALDKNKGLQAQMLNNYEAIIKKINDAGGIVLLDIFGTPQGLGKALDKTSVPTDFKEFKKIAKDHIRNLSCNKGYNIWYEVWSAPDLDDFFLGREQEYFNLYRAVAESVKELETETKIHIPVGGPSVSWWYQNIDGNAITSPQKSLIYELISFCGHNRLPLDFISWHAYSSDPKTESEATPYSRAATALIRDWFSYFNFSRDIPLIVSEWNYDTGNNIAPERQEQAHVSASYILSRLKNMHEAGLNYQLCYSLEDFHGNDEGVNRNTGIFSFSTGKSGDSVENKSIYNFFRMLAGLGKNMFSNQKVNDPFIGLISTRSQERIAVIIYNYLDPDTAMNYLSRNIASLSDAERRIFFNHLKLKKLAKIIDGETDILRLRATNKMKGLFRKAKELNEQYNKFKNAGRKVKLNIKNLKENYLYQRYAVNSSCGINCEFKPVEEKEIAPQDLYQEQLALEPYSVEMIVLEKKPPEPSPPVQPEETKP